jgi:uncharacterized membrane protein
LIKLDADSPAMKTGLKHAAVALASVTLFVVAFALRESGMGRAPLSVLALECLGAAALGGAGYLGGRLVFHHGVGVRPQR